MPENRIFTIPDNPACRSLGKTDKFGIQKNRGKSRIWVVLSDCYLMDHKKEKRKEKTDIREKIKQRVVTEKNMVLGESVILSTFKSYRRRDYLPEYHLQLDFSPKSMETFSYI